MFEGGLTIADQIEFAKLAVGKVDILQIRGGSIDPSQPSYLDPRAVPHRPNAAAIRKGIRDAGIDNLYIDVVGGCQDLDTCEEMLENGEADFIGGARAFIADPGWGNKAYQGRNEDVVPCLRCNKCHVAGPGNWNTVCSVNPEWGLEHKVERLWQAAERMLLIVEPGTPEGFRQLRAAREHFGVLGASFGAYMTALSVLAPNLDLVSWYAMAGGGDVTRDYLEPCWNQYGTNGLPIELLYFVEGEYDNIGPIADSYQGLSNWAGVFTPEQNLRFTVLRQNGHNNQAWPTALYNTAQLFFR